MTFSECIRRLDSTEPVAIQRDKVIGWLKGRKATVEEICAEVNLLDPNETKVITGLFKSAQSIIEQERASADSIAAKNLANAA